MVEKIDISRNQMVHQFLNIGHGDLSIFIDIGLKAARFEPDLFAHFIAWNQNKGEIRDSKVALPVLSLRGNPDNIFYENAAAHLCKLDPGNLLKACYYSKSLSNGQLEIIRSVKDPKKKYTVKKREIVKFPPASVGLGGGKFLKRAVELYVRNREANRTWWNRTAVQHRDSLKSLYALFHIKPSDYANDVLFNKIYEPGSVFEAIKQLKYMGSDEAAGTIINFEIPYLIAVGAIGGIKGKHDIILALLDRMSGNELITNTQMFEKLGVFENPVLNAAYAKAMDKAKSDKRVSTLKAEKAAGVVKSKKATSKLTAIKDEKLERLGGIEGDWLVLGDRSGSMKSTIELSKHMASLIAQQVKGKVYLVFFNTSPILYDVTGKSLSEIQTMSRAVTATGGTSIGCGLDMLYDKGIVVNGIVICSDGGDNTSPLFHNVYEKYSAKFGVEPSVYLFHTPGERNQLTPRCRNSNIALEEHELGSTVDYYKLPNYLKILKTSKYTLVDEILATNLLTFKDVFKGE